MHVVLEITRVEEDDDGEEKIGNHPYRYVQFQVSANLEWNNARMMKYLQNVWRQHKASYTPNVASVVTEAWIFTEYQAAVEKIACLQVHNNYELTYINYFQNIIRDILFTVLSPYICVKRFELRIRVGPYCTSCKLTRPTFNLT